MSWLASPQNWAAAYFNANGVSTDCAEFLVPEEANPFFRLLYADRLVLARVSVNDLFAKLYVEAFPGGRVSSAKEQNVARSQFNLMLLEEFLEGRKGDGMLLKGLIFYAAFLGV